MVYVEMGTSKKILNGVKGITHFLNTGMVIYKTKTRKKGKRQNVSKY